MHDHTRASIVAVLRKARGLRSPIRPEVGFTLPVNAGAGVVPTIPHLIKVVAAREIFLGYLAEKNRSLNSFYARLGPGILQSLTACQ